MKKTMIVLILLAGILLVQGATFAKMLATSHQIGSVYMADPNAPGDE